MQLRRIPHATQMDEYKRYRFPHHRKRIDLVYAVSFAERVLIPQEYRILLNLQSAYLLEHDEKKFFFFSIGNTGKTG